MIKQNHYEILGVEKTATLNEIKRQFKKLALKYHPDKQASTLSEEDKDKNTEYFKAINTAHTVLSDPVKRSLYDSELKVSQLSLDDDEEEVLTAIRFIKNKRLTSNTKPF